MNIKTLAAVTVALTGALGAGLAQAHTDVQWSVTIGAPIFAPPAPVFAPPAPVYVRPAPGWVQPVPVYGRPVPVYRGYHATRWDVDGDGIPNRYDRHYNPRGDRDHDGIPNRRDPRPNQPHGR